jgi:hypothetical protein
LHCRSHSREKLALSLPKGGNLEFLRLCCHFSALYGFPPSPPWGRGWPAAGVFFSRGGPGEGVASQRPSVYSSELAAETSG